MCAVCDCENVFGVREMCSCNEANVGQVDMIIKGKPRNLTSVGAGSIQNQRAAHTRNHRAKFYRVRRSRSKFQFTATINCSSTRAAYVTSKNNITTCVSN